MSKFDWTPIQERIVGRTVKSIVFEGHELWFSDNEVQACTITFDDGSEIYFSSTYDIGDCALYAEFEEPKSKA